MRADVSKHVKDIAEKYLIAGETQAPAIMFVPSESLYAELHDVFSDLIQKAQRAQVIVVSPNILMLAINTIQTVMKDARMREQASLIQKEVGVLLNDVRLLSDRVGKLQTPSRPGRGRHQEHPDLDGQDGRAGRTDRTCRRLDSPKRDACRASNERSERAPGLEGGRERAFVEIIEFAAHRHAMREPRHLHAQRFERVHQIMRRGLAFDGRVHREDDFADTGLHALHELSRRFSRSGVMPSSADSAPPST